MTLMRSLSVTLIAVVSITTLLFTACSSSEKEKVDDPVAANIKMYTHVWDEVMNKGKLELINDSNFAIDVRFKMKPAGSTIVLMKNGKIAEEQDFYDNMDFMTQLGLMPAPGQ